MDLIDNFLKNGLITFLNFLFFCMQLLVDDIDQLSRNDLIELLKRYFSRYERSGLAHFPIVIDTR